MAATWPSGRLICAFVNFQRAKNVDNPAPTLFGLCDGVGMLLEAVGLVFPRSRIACIAEWESGAAATQLARMADKALEPAPIWCGDLAELDARWLRELVDILAAGLPCQPYSSAGLQTGVMDARSYGENGEGPLPQTLRIIAECRPALVFFENVPAFVRGLRTPDGKLCYPFRDFGSELSRMDYEILDPIFVAAEDVKASHGRERVFVLAYDTRQRGKCRRISGESRWLQDRDLKWSDEEALDNSTSTRCNSAWQGSETMFDRRKCMSSGKLADAGREGLEGGERGESSRERNGQAPSRSTSELCGLPIFAPGPADPIWGDVIRNCPHLAPAVEPGVRCMVDGVADFLVCPICHWPEYVRAWRLKTRLSLYAYIQAVSKKTRPTCEASESKLSGVRNKTSEHPRASSRHSKSTLGSDLRLSEMSHGSRCDASKTEKEPGKTMSELPVSNDGESEEKSVLLSSLRYEMESREGNGHQAGHAEKLQGLQSENHRPHSTGQKVLQSKMCHHISKFAVDASRADQLRMVGNGVVPLQAAVAFAVFLMRLRKLLK